MPDREEQLRALTIGEPQVLDGAIELVEYDSAWPGQFDREAARIRSLVGPAALQIEHVGSTSVPGLSAKPRIDILLVVEDSSDEAAYVPALESAGYVLRIREHDWHEHRMLKGPDIDINLHVFSRGCPEIGRMIAFRDLLRSNPGDRDRYERTKRSLASRRWKYVQEYADAKTETIAAILRGA